MRIIQQTVKILTPCNGSEVLQQIEYAGRTCYASQRKTTANSAPAFVRSLIKRGHMSPLEFGDMTAE
jgi:thymidylate synthase, flavin-dependent